MILILIPVVIITIFVIILFINNKKTIELFRIHNVAIFGAKGKGKDLLMQLVISYKDQPYYSNINFGGKFKEIKLKDLSVEPNTYENFIQNKLRKIKKDITRENMDVYLSDIGVILPSQYDNLLTREYKSLPIYYALSRHLYNQNIHFNTQALNRVWIKLREQADYYILCRGVIDIGIALLIKITTYDNYQSAELKLREPRQRILNAYSKAEQDNYTQMNGEIKEMTVAIPKWKIKYDTRAYHKILFKKPAPTKREQKQIERMNKQ